MPAVATLGSIPWLHQIFCASAATSPPVGAGIQRRETNTATNCPAMNQAPVVHNVSIWHASTMVAS
jgi:hypothetical protein